MPSSRRLLGSDGEDRVAELYESRGYEIVARNWRVSCGELDLVARRGRELVFCEVKTRSSDRFGSPSEAVTPAKQRRIRRLAAAYLAGSVNGSPTTGVVRFDVACVSGGVIEVIEQAF